MQSTESISSSYHHYQSKKFVTTNKMQLTYVTALLASMAVHSVMAAPTANAVDARDPKGKGKKHHEGFEFGASSHSCTFKLGTD